MKRKVEEFRSLLAALFQEQSLAVVATHSAGQPYASLVAFWVDEALRNIYFMTPKATRKYANIASDSRVAVLINSAANQTTDFHRAVSVTIEGAATEVDGAAREPIIDAYLKKHPYLRDFSKAPSVALIRIAASRYYLVKNFQNVMELHVDDELDSDSA